MGLWVSRSKDGQEKSAEDYFLASKSLPWWAIGASLIAANISAEQFIGRPSRCMSIGRPPCRKGFALKFNIALAGHAGMFVQTCSRAETIMGVPMPWRPKYIQVVFHTVSGGAGMWAGMQALMDAAPERFVMILERGHPQYNNLPGIGVLVGMWVANLYYWGFNQYIIQRTLAAKSLKEAQRGILFAAGLKLILPLVVVLPGIAAFVMVNDPARRRPTQGGGQGVSALSCQQASARACTSPPFSPWANCRLVSGLAA